MTPLTGSCIRTYGIHVAAEKDHLDFVRAVRRARRCALIARCAARAQKRSARPRKNRWNSKCFLRFWIGLADLRGGAAPACAQWRSASVSYRYARMSVPRGSLETE